MVNSAHSFIGELPANVVQRQRVRRGNHSNTFEAPNVPNPGAKKIRREHGFVVSGTYWEYRG